MTNAENCLSEPPNLKIVWGRIPPTPPTRLVPPAFAIIPLARLLNIASGIYTYFTNISEGTAFLFQGLTYKEEVRLRRFNLK